MNSSIELAESFLQYCKEHPKERFWQALRNWSGHAYVLISFNKDKISGEYKDTFYFKGKDS